MRFYIATDSLIHSLRRFSWNPYFMALFTGLNTDVLKKIELIFYKTIDSDFSVTEFSSADSARIFIHVVFSLLVFGSSHFAGSNQWTVII